mmetsp:Transcript_42326/g.76787  ORF Transcript_42326/g.76787 Transcript_42326/m.76787 type:complete len:189 (+) Transcript_42326:41-607(+)
MSADDDEPLPTAAQVRELQKVILAFHRLQTASDEEKKDRELVLHAVSKNGHALQFAAPELKRDRTVVLAAVAQDPLALEHAGAELLEDEEFAVEARKLFYFFRIISLAGRATVVALDAATASLGALGLMAKSGSKIGIRCTGDTTLLFGTMEVPNDSKEVETWPGSPKLGGPIVEYQLIKSKRARPAA